MLTVTIWLFLYETKNTSSTSKHLYVTPDTIIVYNVSMYIYKCARVNDTSICIIVRKLRFPSVKEFVPVNVPTFSRKFPSSVRD